MSRYWWFSHCGSWWLWAFPSTCCCLKWLHVVTFWSLLYCTCSALHQWWPMQCLFRIPCIWPLGPLGWCWPLCWELLRQNHLTLNISLPLVLCSKSQFIKVFDDMKNIKFLLLLLTASWNNVPKHLITTQLCSLLLTVYLYLTGKHWLYIELFLVTLQIMKLLGRTWI